MKHVTDVTITVGGTSDGGEECMQKRQKTFTSIT